MISYWLFGLLLLAQLLFARHLSWPQLMLGVFAWTFLEYAFHRFAFHSPSTHRMMAKLNDGKHAMHHEKPGAMEHMTVPLLFAGVLYGGIFGLYWLPTSTSSALSFGSGVLVGYLVYEFTHYMCHKLHPKTHILKKLKRYHMEHHFLNKDSRFGVTSPMWDRFFNTTKTDDEEWL